MNASYDNLPLYCICILLCSIEGKPPPDPFYVDQVRATLLHLETLNVPNTCQNR